MAVVHPRSSRGSLQSAEVLIAGCGKYLFLPARLRDAGTGRIEGIRAFRLAHLGEVTFHGGISPMKCDEHVLPEPEILLPLKEVGRYFVTGTCMSCRKFD